MERTLVLTAAGGLAVGACAASLREGVPPLAVAAAALFALLAVAYHWRHALGSQRPHAGTPIVPGALPLLGNALQVLPNLHRIHDWVVEQQRGVGRGGATFAFSVPFLRTFYCVTDPAALEWVLKGRMTNYVKGEVVEANFGPLLGRGIFAVDGEEWRWQRKLATRIFSVKSFKQYVGEVFSAKADLLLRRLAAACPSSRGGDDSGALGVAPGEPVDLHDLMYRFTLDTFSRIGFGTDPGCLTTAGRLPFAVAFDRAQRTTNARFWVPCWPLLEFLDGRGRQLRRDIATIRTFAAGIIAARRELMHTPHACCGAATPAASCCDGAGGAEPPSSPASSSASAPDSFARGDQAPLGGGGFGGNDTAEALGKGPSVSSQVKQWQQQQRGGDEEGAGGRRPAQDEASSDLLGLFMTEDGPDGAPLGDEALVDTVLNFIIAGRDTTAQALSWTLHHVMNRPDIESKILSEAETVLGPASADAQRHARTQQQGDRSDAYSSGGGGGGGGKPTYDQLHALKYARAVFLEGLRLHPSVPENAKFALRADVLPGGTRVPAGAMILYSPFAINRMREFWGPDADEFRPERWEELAHAPSAYSFPSFNAGPRICLGQRLAELEGVYVLVLLLRRFRLRPAAGRPVQYELSVSMPMKDGLWAHIEERAACA